MSQYNTLKFHYFCLVYSHQQCIWEPPKPSIASCFDTQLCGSKKTQIERKVLGLKHQLTVLHGIMFAYQDMLKQVYGSFVQYMF